MTPSKALDHDTMQLGAVGGESTVRRKSRTTCQSTLGKRMNREAMQSRESRPLSQRPGYQMTFATSSSPTPRNSTSSTTTQSPRALMPFKSQTLILGPSMMSAALHVEMDVRFYFLDFLCFINYIYVEVIFD